MVPPLPPEGCILDLGCGVGTQTIDLARGCAARLVAVDNHEPFLRSLRSRVAELGLGARIEPTLGDMGDLRFADASFDAIWCEGAIFVVGFAHGLASWRRLLKPGGHLVVSELCWLTEDPPTELRTFFEAEGADIEGLARRREVIEASGYRLVGDFVLPHTGWWENYYVPLAATLARFRTAHANEAEALAVADRSQHEIDLYTSHAAHFGYGFFVMQRD
jgi:ubiquinone/menaquinone biosynthesis C-methylase UbiE